MKNHIRCVGCGRRHKPGHDKRIGTKLQYDKNCMDLKDGKALILKQREEARIKAEEAKKEQEKKVKEEAEKAEKAEKAKSEVVKEVAVEAVTGAVTEEAK